MQEIFERVAGVPLGDLFEAWIRSSSEIDYDATLAHVGLVVERAPRPDGPTCSLGVRARSDGGRTIVSSVVRDGSAWRAGVDAGDELIAIGSARLDGANVESALRGHAPGDEVELLLARDGRVVQKRAVLDAPRHDKIKLRANPDAPGGTRDAFAAWLGEPHPAWSAGTAGQA